MSQASKILVVDDTPTNVLVMQRTLEKAGYEVCVATDGFKAEEIAAREPLDLILLDMMMPDRDGIEVCEMLKSCPATEKIPVIFVTAHTERSKIVDAFSVGGSDYITKPFRADELLARVDVHLKVRRAENELLEKNTQLQRLANQLADVNTELAQQARLDPLTKLLNRRAWTESAELEIERSIREQRSYSIVMIDVDHFKAYNDSLGHQAGDECLRSVAKSLKETSRAIDLVGRYGGEEFIILAPETDVKGAAIFAERVCRTINELNLAHPASPVTTCVTISVGVSTAAGGALPVIIEEADNSLYVAKEEGRNRVIVHQWHREEESKKLPVNESKGPIEIPMVETDNDIALVLIIDDCQGRRTRCQQSLIDEGYRVDLVSDCVAAKSKIESQRPEVILVSVSLLQIKNRHCLEEFKNDPNISDIPIILIGGEADAELIEAGLQAGATDYINDPINPIELATRVRSMSKLSREHKNLIGSYVFRSHLARVLDRLQDYCHSITITTDLDRMLELTISTISDIASCRRVSILLPDSVNQTLKIAKSMGIDEQLASTISIPIGDGIAGRVFSTAQSIVVNSDDDPAPQSSHYDNVLFASKPFFSAPMGSASAPIGVVNVTDRVNNVAFEPYELEFLDLLAGIAGSAIQSLISNEARDQARDSIIIALAKLAEHRDSETGAHLERVMRYSLMLAEQLRKKQGLHAVIDDHFLNDLRRAVPLHDIGKVAVPDSILHKPGRLTNEEMSVMKTHTTIGAETLLPVIVKTPGAKFLEMAERIARSHHECFNGSGYPNGISGEDIPLSARIVAVADVYDALTTKRVYKDAMSHEESRAIIISHANTQFDPDVIEAFLERENDFIELAEELKDTPKPDPRADWLDPNEAQTVPTAIPC